MIRKALLLVLTVGGAGLAHADASADSPGLFREFHFTFAHDPGPVREAARDMANACAMSSPHSRIGPRMRDAERCQKSEATIIAAAGDGARAVLEIIDDDNAVTTSRYRLYDAVGRTGDATMIAPLVAALQKLQSARFADRESERFSIAGALRTLSYSKIGESSPFRRSSEPSAHQMAAAWSAWAKSHQGRTHRELFDERIADARGHVADHDIAVAYDAASFLVAYPDTHADGLAALAQLGTRDGLSPFERAMIDNATRTPVTPAPVATEGKV
jgi:hypothetical protein